MTPDGSDAFVQFAMRCGLQMSAEEVSAVPRDVLAPPVDLQWHTLMTLDRPGIHHATLQTIFVSETADRRPPSIRDALWWLASDCWALEHVERDYQRWAATYHYCVDDPATSRLFQLQVNRANALMALLGRSAYNELLAIYATEIRSDTGSAASVSR